MVNLVGKGYVLWVNCFFCGKIDLPVGNGFVLWAKGLCCTQCFSCGQMVYIVGKGYVFWVNCLYFGKVIYLWAVSDMDVPMKAISREQ
jgi:hypothetical protein